MFSIHKEGFKILARSLILFPLLAFGAYYLHPIAGLIIGVGLFILLILVLQFFRNPVRNIPVLDDNIIYAPADGKIVVIEETEETEFYKDKRIQISIFMSPLNVHVNRYPFSGQVKYYKYHPGQYLVAWHPKSSTENERTTMVLEKGKNSILVRQIAGAVARRIISYAKKGLQGKQGEDFGFIRFGSRVDLFLPLDAKIEVNIDDVVKGNLTKIATFK
jgi:phosphatidylserine decarboxylase